MKKNHCLICLHGLGPDESSCGVCGTDRAEAQRIYDDTMFGALEKVREAFKDLLITLNGGVEPEWMKSK